MLTFNSMEKMMADLTVLLNAQDFKSDAEMKKFLDNELKKKNTPERLAGTAEAEAQELIYEAWETNKRGERIRLAKRAISIFPDCADAYNILAENAAKSLGEAVRLYEKAVEAGERALGKEAFKETKGHFWGFVSTRPYMRARAGLMECLWAMGDHDSAIDHAKEMLKLNVNDNQGIRYILIRYLAELGHFDTLETFMNRRDYRNDAAADWMYTKVLLLFVKNGDSPKSRKALTDAIKMNSYVPKYLAGEKRIPQSLPDTITMGGEDEAYCYAAAYGTAWRKVPDAIGWLRTQKDVAAHA